MMDLKVAKIGMLFFLATEAMFFAGLISAYWILRSQIAPWPPVDQPRLSAVVTGINTLILLLSAVVLWQTERALKVRNQKGIARWLGLAVAGGVVFLAVQGYEWVRLIGFGMATTNNIYGGLFYVVVGAHALHVLCALIVLLVVTAHAVQGRYTEDNHAGLILGRMFWTFVVLVWPILYALVYF